MDPHGRQVPQELLERPDPLISPWKGELDLVALANAHVSHVVERQSSIVNSLAKLREGRDVHMAVGNPCVDAFGTQLPGEQKLFVGGAGGDADRESQLHLLLQCLLPTTSYQQSC